MGVELEAHRWGVQLCILPSKRIQLRLLADFRSAVLVCMSPIEAMETIALFLTGFVSAEDELVLSARDVQSSDAWSTRSRWAGLYWCASLLSKWWPPPWVPIVERRGVRRFAGVPPFEPPLIERRRSRAGSDATRTLKRRHTD